MTDDTDWEARVDALSLTPQAIELRKALDEALYNYWAFFSSNGVAPGIRVSVGENGSPRRKVH